MNMSNVGEILRLANYFLLNNLKTCCTKYLEHSLHVTNVYKIKDMTEKWGMLALSKTIHAFILANLLEVVEQDEILHFDEHKINGLISNKSYPLMEELKVHIICRWVRQDIVGRYLKFQQLMTHIQWPKVNIQVIYDMIPGEKLFSESEYCLWYLLKVLEDRGSLLNVYIENLRYLEKKIQEGQNIEHQLLEKMKREKEESCKTSAVNSDSMSRLVDPNTGAVNAGKTETETMPEDGAAMSLDENFTRNRNNSTRENDELEVMPELPQHEEDLDLNVVSNKSADDNHLDTTDDIKPSEQTNSVLDTTDDVKPSEHLNSVFSTVDDNSSFTESPGKHKRKGRRPVKLRIPKSRLRHLVFPKTGKLLNSDIKEEGIKKVKKKRGRPPKKLPIMTVKVKNLFYCVCVLILYGLI